MTRISASVALTSCLLISACNGGMAGRQITISPATLPTAIVGRPFSIAVKADGAPPARWSVTGDLPPGISFPTGEGRSPNFLSGVASRAGSFPFTIEVTDAYGITGRRDYVLEVEPLTPVPPPGIFTLTPPAYSPLVNATVGEVYSATITIDGGGTGPYSLSGLGFMPQGLAIAQVGTDSLVISGRPAQVGFYVVSVRVEDAARFVETEDFYLNVVPPPPIFTVLPPPGSKLGYGTVGERYEMGFLLTAGGTAPYTFQGAGLPPGLAVYPTGLTTFALSGTPSAAGEYMFWVLVTDAAGMTESHVYSMTVYERAAPYIDPGSLNDADVGWYYAETFTLENSSGGVSWSASGELPPGLWLDSAGCLSGTPLVSGVFSFTIQAVDRSGVRVLQSYSLVVW